LRGGLIIHLFGFTDGDVEHRQEQE
jgi:hypothetical protein